MAGGSFIRRGEMQLVASGASKFKESLLSGGRAASVLQTHAAGAAAAIGGMGVAMQVATGAIVAYAGAKGLQAAIQQTVQFESATADLQKQLGEVAGTEAANTMRDLATQMPIARDRLMEVAESAARLGVRGTERLQEFTAVAAKIGVATDMGAQEAAEALARVGPVLDITVARMENFASSINELSKTLPRSFSDITDAVTRAAGGFATLDVQAPALAAMTAQVAALSASARRAGTRMRRFGQSLQNPKRLNDIADAFAGISRKGLKQLVDRSPTEAMLALAAAMRRGGDAAEALNRIFPTTVRDALSKMAKRLPQVKESIDLASTALRQNTSIQEEFEKRIDTTISRLQQAGNIASDFGIAAGQPPVRGLNDMIAAFNKLGESTETMRRVRAVLDGIGQTVTTVTRLVFNFVEVIGNALTGTFRFAVMKAGNVLNNFLIDPLNQLLEFAGRDFQFARVDVEGFRQAFQKDTRDIVGDVKDMDEAFMNLGESAAVAVDEFGAMNLVMETYGQRAQTTRQFVRDLLNPLNEIPLSVNDALSGGIERMNRSYDILGEAVASTNKELENTISILSEFQRLRTDIRDQPFLLPGIGPPTIAGTIPGMRRRAAAARRAPGRPGGVRMPGQGGLPFVRTVSRSRAERPMSKMNKLMMNFSQEVVNWNDNAGDATRQVRAFTSAIGSLSAALGNTVTKILNFASQAAIAVSQIISGNPFLAAASAIQGFAGLFQHGGRIGPGQFGIAGEAGPEIVTGPADVTPMDDVNTGGVTFDFSDFPEPKDPRQAARDREWQRFLAESVDSAKQSGVEF